MKLEEIGEARASGRVAEVYADIRKVLRTTRTDLLFRVLAARGGYLAAAWEALRPNAATAYFERCADSLRMRMVPPMPADVPDLEEELDERGYEEERIDAIAGVLDAYLYSLPKCLILAAALRGALNGVRIGGAAPGSPDDLAPLREGPPASMPTPDPVGPDGSPEALRGLYAEIAASDPSGAVPDVWRALGRHPEFAALAWPFVKQELAGKGFEVTVDLSRGAAAAAAQEFPHPVTLDRGKAAALGLAEAEIDAIDRELGAFIHLIPKTASSIHLMKAALLGEGRVRRKPFENE